MADRLSDLPESLQLRILSCLDARDAVQTMVLSKSWVSTWASTPVLNFSSDGFRNVDVFDRFVADALARRQPVKLDRLTFEHDEKYCCKSFEKVFEYALSHGVEALEYFGRCLFLKPRSGSFKNLTNLHLEFATITDLDPFSGFPELVKLKLDFCVLITKGMVLNVHAPKLSEFTISCSSYVNRCEFTTPKLRYFEWRGTNFPLLVTHEGGFPILDTVIIDYNFCSVQREARKMFDDLLMLFNSLHNARSLTLFSPVVQLLTLFPVNGCSPFRDLKCLKLDFRIYCSKYFSQGPRRQLLELLKLVPGLKAYLLPESHDAKCSVMVTDRRRPKAMAVLDSSVIVN